MIKQVQKDETMRNLFKKRKICDEFGF